MLLVYLSRRIERAARGDGTDAVPGKEGTPLDGYENRRHTACLRHPCRRERLDNGNAEIGGAGCAVREDLPCGSGQRVPCFRQAAGTAEPDGVLGRDEGEAAQKDAGHGQQVIGKSAASR